MIVLIRLLLFENPFNSGGSFTSNVNNIKNNWDREDCKLF